MACGSSDTISTAPPAALTTPDTGALADGGSWELGRPIRLTFETDVDFDSVSLATVRVRRVSDLAVVLGSLAQGLDPATGAPDPRVVIFQPYCPVDAADVDSGGFQRGTEYRLEVVGADSGGDALLSATGDPLDESFELDFTTVTGDDPAILFHDPVPGPPRLVVRGADGVAADEGTALHVAIGDGPTDAVYVQQDGAGQLSFDAAAPGLVAGGLPLNHRVARDHRVHVRLVFDQPIETSADNYARIGLEFEDLAGEWRPIPTEAVLYDPCGLRGTMLGLEPVGTLPAGNALRVVLRAGFADRTLEAHGADVTLELPFAGTAAVEPAGAPLDAIVEGFRFGDDAPGSMEDITSDLGAPRAGWGGGFVGTSGLEEQRARSKWYGLGRAGHVLGAPEEAPVFAFSGTDANGRVEHAQGTVTLGAASIGSAFVSEIGADDLHLPVGELGDAEGRITDLPALLTLDRLHLRDITDGDELLKPIVSASSQNGDVRLGLGACYPFYGDCVPGDLAASFAPLATFADVYPRSFDVYSGFSRDTLGDDQRITFRFDATVEGADGEPDPAAAYSVTNGWAPHPSAFDGGDWDFIRFEVWFEADVSGDGLGPGEIYPSLDFVKVIVDHRR